MKKIKLITILGTDRSGSTLLDMIISSNRLMFSLGEIHRFIYYYKNNHLCTCGQRFYECSFWKSILKKLEKSTFDPGQISILGWKRQLSILFEILFLSKNRIRKKYKDYIDAYAVLFQSVLAQTGAEYIVDSCKDIIRAYILHLSGRFEIFPIYLNRSVNDYAISIRKPQMKLNPHRRTGPNKAILRWTFRNSLTWLLIGRIRKNYLQLTYHRLASRPEEVINHISHRLGVSLQYDTQLIAKTRYHFLGGNLMKFEKFNGVRIDVKNSSDVFNSIGYQRLVRRLDCIFLRNNI